MIVDVLYFSQSLQVSAYCWRVSPLLKTALMRMSSSLSDSFFCFGKLSSFMACELYSSHVNFTQGFRYFKIGRHWTHLISSAGCAPRLWTDELWRCVVYWCSIHIRIGCLEDAVVRTSFFTLTVELYLVQFSFSSLSILRFNCQFFHVSLICIIGIKFGFF